MAKEKAQLEQQIESLQEKILELDERRKSLQESENLLSIITRTTSSAIFIIQNEKICFINKAGEQLFGCKSPEIYLEDLNNLISEEDIEFIKTATVVNPGETLKENAEVHVKNPLKGERIVEITVVSIFYKGKIAFVCTAYDVTGYQQSKDISSENQSLLKIIDAFPIGVSLIDTNGTIIAENKLMHDIWQNGTDSSFESVKVYDHKTGELIKQDEWIIARALQCSETFFNEIFTIEIGLDRKTIRISAVPVNQSNDQLTGVLVTCEDITSQVVIEEKCKQLRAIIEFSDDAIIGKDLSGNIISWNKGARKMFGYKAQEVLGKPASIMIPAEYQDEIEHVCNATKNGENIEHYETKRIRKDGTLIDISISFSPIKNTAGEVIGISSIAHDITLQRASAEKLRESEERFRRIFKEGPIGIAIVGLDYRFNNVNNKLCEILGYTKQEFRTKTLANICYQDDSEIESDIKQTEALSKGEIPFYNIDKRYVKKDGTVLWVNLNVSMIRDRNNNPLYYLLLIEDITARKEAELRIIESEELYRTLAKNFPNGMVFLFDKDLRYKIADGAGLKENGFISEMAEGDTVWNVFPSEVSSVLEPYYRDALNGKESVFEKEHSGKIFEVRTLPIKNTDGDITAGMAMILDITERKNNEKMLKDLLSSKDKFFSIVAHDLKNPFTSLLGFSEMLSNDFDSLNDSEIKDLSSTIYKSAKSIFSLLENLLQWSKIQSGRMEFIPGTFSLNEVIDQAVSIFQPNAIRKRINLISNLDMQYCVQADKNMIDSIIRNLVSNAIKFTPNGGNIKINAERQNGLVKINVQDNGVGIKAEVLDNLFKIDKSTITLGTDKERGTGLGLILSKEFAEKNGGKIWVESEPGKGSKFTFTVPVSKN